MTKNLGSLVKGIATLQKRMDEVQKELGEAIFEGSAAQGLVKVQVTGKGEIKRVDIAPAAMSEDAETLGDLVVVAARAAHDAKEAVAKEKLAAVTKGMLPMGLKIPGMA